MTQPNVPERKPKRALDLAVGDRIDRRQLPRLFGTGDPVVVFVKGHRYCSSSFVFVAVAYDDGFHDSTSFEPGAWIDVIPAPVAGEPENPDPAVMDVVERRRASDAVHFLLVDEDLACSLSPVPPGTRTTSELEQVTCAGCRKALKLDEPVSEAR